MKARRVALVGIFCVVSLVVFGANAKDKPDKPDKPDKSTTEWIAFVGDLVGAQEVEGCCPNAGPFPSYTMEVPNSVGYLQQGIYEGQLFINFYGVGKDKKYIVQFWNDEIAIEIVGGVITQDKKSKVLTVTFDKETCVDLYDKSFVANLSFVLTRAPY
jgi:hypothetical protein